MTERATFVDMAHLGDVPEANALPPQWRKLSEGANVVTKNCRAYRKNFGDYSMFVIVTAEVYSDGSKWLHVSASRPKRVPSYEDLCEVWKLFGNGLEGVQKWVRPEEHVNEHHNCLHLWARMDGGFITPDFRRKDEGKALSV